MLRYISRRLVTAFFVLLAATALMYVLVAYSGDPLADLYEDNSPNRAEKIAQRTELLNLDVPVWQRYLLWLGGAAKCFTGSCELGANIAGQDVVSLMGPALATTARLVFVALILAVFLGVIVGILSALRQYSGFDYTVTLLSFLFFSLPVFWVAVLLKEFGAIRFNDWLRDPVISAPTIILFAVLAGIAAAMTLGGDLRRRLIVGMGGGLIVAALLAGMSASKWFARPALGPVLVALLAVAFAVAVAALITGLGRRRILGAAVTTAAVGAVLNLALAPVLRDPSPLLLVGLFAVTLVVSYGLGRIIGGPEDGPVAARVAMASGAGAAFLIAADRLLSSFSTYARQSNGRPIPTVGEGSTDLSTVWLSGLSVAAALILPTAALILISFATYTRYTRASMLEIMEQDYIRTARAKGLSERTVVVRHAFRNGLIPLTTIVAYDFAGVIGGAVVTERVFAWRGMGTFFIDGLLRVDPNPVMAFFLVTGVATVVFNLLADILYAVLDPRIRLS